MADKFKFLKPAPGMPAVMDPLTMNCIAAAGEWKPWTGPEGRYWRRRVGDGSVIEAQPQTVATAAPSRKAEQPAAKRGGGGGE